LAGVGQTVPHFPQLVTSESNFTQAPVHGEYPPLHVMSQPLAPQVGEPLAGVGQLTPQSPQLDVSIVTSTHAPEQFLSALGQFDTHLPTEHT